MKDMKERMIMGIDPGFGRMGFGVIRVTGRELTALDFGVFTTETKLDFASRLAYLAEDLQTMVVHWHPQLLALESLFFSGNQKTAMRVAEARGVVLLMAAQQRIPVVEFSPGQVKLALTGDGKAGKAAVQRMVKQLLALPRAPKPDDAADALAIAITASTITPPSFSRRG